MIDKTDNRLWALLEGGHELGESIADNVVREVKEETGYDVEVTGLTGTYTNPNHVMAYEDGEVRQQFSIAFTARLGGEDRTSSESKRVERGRAIARTRPQDAPTNAPALEGCPRRRSSPHQLTAVGNVLWLGCPERPASQDPAQ